MKSYTDHLSAPLKFHSFFRFVWLPLQFIACVANAAGFYMADIALEGYYIFDFGYYAISSVLMVVAFLGAFRFKDYFLWAVYAGLAVELAYYTVIFAVTVIYNPGNMSTAFASLFGVLVRDILIFIYYNKRKALFTKDGFNIKLAKSVQDDYLESGGYVSTYRNHNTSCDPNCRVERSTIYGEAMFIHRDIEDENRKCPDCGHEIMAGDKFCVLCGAKL